MMQAKNVMLRIIVTNQISHQRLGDMLVGAFEGGSHYWIEKIRCVKPRELKTRYDAKTVFDHVDFPMNPGGSVVITTYEEWASGKRRVILTLNKILKGAQKMAKERPVSFQQIIDENDDATNADLFLQYCVFGKEIFG